MKFNNKENVSDVLNELLKDGAQQLIHQVVEARLSEYLSQHQRLIVDGRVAMVCRLPVKTRDTDRYRSSQCAYSQGAFERWRGANFSFCIGSALRLKNEILGGSITLAVTERCSYRRDGRSTKSSGWA